MIQSISSRPLLQASPCRQQASQQLIPDSTRPVADVAEISSSPKVAPSGFLQGLKKTGMMVALAACLAGPFTSSAQAQCQPTYGYGYPQRPVAVRTYPGHGPGYGREHHRRSAEPRIGISIGPGGVHIEAQVGRPRSWQQPPVVIQQPPIVIQQPPIVIQQPPVVIQQPGWFWGR